MQERIKKNSPELMKSFKDIREAISSAAQLSCLLEVCTPKPGNVHPGAAFDDTSFEDFIISAVAIGAVIQRVDRLNVGQTIWEAIKATQKMVRVNTNLGMVLLLVPLARACLYGSHGDSERSNTSPSLLPGLKILRENLSNVLAGLTVEDARLAYRAIRQARPGGLGRVEEGDISEAPAINLYQAMEMAREKDSIAREYVTDYEITFNLSYPYLRETRRKTESLPAAIVQTFIRILSEVPDSLISRKKGLDKARQVSEFARQTLAAGGIFNGKGKNRIKEMDALLRSEGNKLNPGTTADLVTAAIFLFLLYDRFPDQA